MKHSVAAVFLSAGLCALAISDAFGDVYSVKPDESGDYATIQDAIDAAASGDTILLGTGTFTGTGNKNLDPGGKAVVIASVAGAQSTVIDCEDAGRGFFVHNGEGSGTVISGITVANGSAASLDGYGGAVYCHDASPTIANCDFWSCYADSGAAVALVRSGARVVRNHFVDNNCHWQCEDPDHPPVIGVEMGAVYCLDSDVTFVDNDFRKNMTGYYGAEGCALWASHSTLSIVGNRFDANGQVQGGGPVYADSCTVEIVGNHFHDNVGESSGGLNLSRCTGVVRANRFDHNEPHCVSGAIHVSESALTIDFNLITDNGGIGIFAVGTTGIVRRNVVSRGHFICMEDGRGMVVLNSTDLAITNNVLYENCADGSPSHGTELTYSGSAPTIENNVLVNHIDQAMVACDATPSWPSLSPSEVDSVIETDNWFDGDPLAWIYSYQYGCVDPGYFSPCGFCDPDNDNWFLQPDSPCVIDSVFPGGGVGGNDLYVYRFAGALPLGCGTPDVVSVSAPPDDIVTSPPPDGVYVLSGFSVTNTSDREAPLYYRVLFDGEATPLDRGDPLAFVGVTPVLQAGESFSPPAAALRVTGLQGPSVSTVSYLVAYPPALNLPDTLVTTVAFDLPTGVATNSMLDLGLGQNVPNPFNPATTIRYRLQYPGPVSLVIYDVAGQRVRTLVDGRRVAGTVHEVQWDGRDDGGREVSSGVYFYRLIAGEFSQTKKMVLLK